MAKKKKTYEGLDSIAKPKKRNDKTGSDGRQYSITPKGVLLMALCDVYGVEASIDRLEDFMKKVVGGLSLIATGGSDAALLGEDFNDFFRLYVDTLNLCGRMKEKLDENGIDFDMDAED